MSQLENPREAFHDNRGNGRNIDSLDPRAFRQHVRPQVRSLYAAHMAHKAQGRPPRTICRRRLEDIFKLEVIENEPPCLNWDRRQRRFGRHADLEHGRQVLGPRRVGAAALERDGALLHGPPLTGE